ncbi:MAG TPA: 50S ribosomal protein L22 [Candidatus Nanoarchaeia archaeon]|nr:50S ribosomal protein L22 [Candidatus Nanoarchaeia archaeon]
MTAKYSFQKYNNETMARALGRSLPISTRQSVEICNFVRGKNLEKAKNAMKRVIEKKQAVPYRIYNDGIGHKPGIGPGKYPVNACTQILQLIESAEANAQFKGLDSAKLVIAHLNAHQASRAWHYGRKRRRKMKRTNIEVVLEEQKTEEKQNPDKK